MNAVVNQYTHHPHHRDTSRRYEKSQWVISIPEELNCFNLAVASGWAEDSNCWGLHLANQNPMVLGQYGVVNSAYIAKFVTDQNIWHGYPVVHWNTPYDRPGQNVLNAWQAAGFITRPVKSKIVRGKKCDL